jgi:hypothetical protein
MEDETDKVSALMDDKKIIKEKQLEWKQQGWGSQGKCMPSDKRPLRLTLCFMFEIVISLQHGSGP